MFYLLEETYAHLTRIEYENYVYSKSFRLGTMSTADSRESCRRSSDTAVRFPWFCFPWPSSLAGGFVSSHGASQVFSMFPLFMSNYIDIYVYIYIDIS